MVHPSLHSPPVGERGGGADREGHRLNYRGARTHRDSGAGRRGSARRLPVRSVTFPPGPPQLDKSARLARLTSRTSRASVPASALASGLLRHACTCVCAHARTRVVGGGLRGGGKAVVARSGSRVGGGLRGRALPRPSGPPLLDHARSLACSSARSPSRILPRF